MAKRQVKMKYFCYNDCKIQGCPGHTATLQVQTVSDSIRFDNGFSQEPYYFDPSTLEVLINLLQKVDYLPNPKKGKK